MYEGKFNENFEPKIIVITLSGIYARESNNNNNNWDWPKTDHRLAIDVVFSRLEKATIHNDEPIIDAVAELIVCAVSETPVQVPEFKVNQSFQVSQIVELKLEHFFQFCTWQFLIVSLINFETELETPEIEEAT